MKYKLLLILIVVIGFFFRFWQISEVPPSLSNDEISIAYEAYSIANIGKDSTGAFLPLSFRSHGDYKAPLYVYVAAPFIKIFGNNEIAVRLPSVIFGTLTILALYLLVAQMSKNKHLALLSSFLLAITPWHVYTSRIALESNLALFFVVLGAYLFFASFQKKNLIFFSAVSFALSVYSYHTETVFTPLLMLVLCLVYRARIDRKRIIYLWSMFILAILPLALNFFLGEGGTRASTEVIFNDLFLRNRLFGVINPFTKIFIFVSFWIGKYLKYIDPGFIFVNGLPVAPAYSSSEFGLMNLITLPVLVLGILGLTKSSNRSKEFLWLYWLGAGALVPSLTLGETNYVRYLVSVIPLVVLVARGFIWIKERAKNIFYALSLVLVAVNFIFFYKYYIKLFPFHFSQNWQYGYKQAAEYIKENGAKYDQIIIDPAFGVEKNNYAGVPNLYLLYFNKLDPQLFLDTKKSGKEELEFMNRYHIRHVDWIKEKIEGKSLYLVSVHSTPLPSQKDIIKEIYSINILDGTKAFKLYESN
jgi:4-amino-4-deoxy-L-arabinose transferase-like glycosyltransferase